MTQFYTIAVKAIILIFSANFWLGTLYKLPVWKSFCSEAGLYWEF